MTPTVSWDPFAPGYTDDPYPQLATLRESTRVDAHPLGFYVLTRYDDVAALLRADLSVEGRSLSPDSPMRALVPGGPGGERVGGMSMLDRDPPDHTRLRRLVSRAFTARTVAGLEPRVRALVDDALDDLVRSDDPDLVASLAFPLPFAVITELLGMPTADTELVRSCSGLVVRSLEPVQDPEVAAHVLDAEQTLQAVVRDAVAWKRRHPADDLLTGLVRAEEDGDALTEEELVAQVGLLYVAGHETTVNLIAGGVLALLHHPDQLRRLRDDASLAPGAVEEMLRYDAPVQMTRRITTRPWQVGEEEVPAGAYVVGHVAAANRDPRRFGADADRLVLDRPTARDHLSLGHGVHHCLGAALARLEARLALEALALRLPELRLAGSPTWNGRINLRGPARLPVAW